MKEIYPLNFEQEIEFVVGPNLQVQGLIPCLVPVERIVGFDLIQPCDQFKPIMFFPIPVALESHGLFTLLPEETYWKPDLSGITASHVFCMQLPSELPEEIRQQIISMVNTIHANRTLLTKKEVYDRVNDNEKLQEVIKSVSGCDGDVLKLLGFLLINNRYEKPPQTRKPIPMKPQNNNSSTEGNESPEKSSIMGQNDFPQDEDYKNAWNEFAKQNHGVLTFDEIIVQTVSNKKATRKRLHELIRDSEDLAKVWKKVSDGLEAQREKEKSS